jgi:hypothetical protein
MKRKLVLTNDASRHPYRQTLPLTAISVEAPYRAGEETENIRLFLMTFTAAFLAISGFIW